MVLPCVLLVFAIPGILGQLANEKVPNTSGAPVSAITIKREVEKAFGDVARKTNFSNKPLIDFSSNMKPDFHLLCPMARRTPQTQKDAEVASLGLETIKQLSNSTGIPVKDILTSEKWSDELSSSFRTYCVEKADTFMCDPQSPYRTIDGSCNNLGHPAWGMAGAPQRRFIPPAYDDGYNSPRSVGEDGEPLPNPRHISNVFHKAKKETIDSKLSMIAMAWGQFINHDIIGTPLMKGENGRSLDCCGKDQGNPACIPIDIPSGDNHFTKPCMNVVRAAPAAGPECYIGARQQINKVTSYLDGSALYGSTKEEEMLIRKMEYGELREAPYHLLPPGDSKDCILQKKGQTCQYAGDERSNIVASVGAIHTLLMREHNRIVRILHYYNPKWNDEKLFQETRKIMSAIIQHITLHEYLPLIIGKPETTLYDIVDRVFGHTYTYAEIANAGITNAFAAAAFRFGHSQIPKDQTYIGPEFKYKRGVNIEKTFHKPFYLQRTKHFGYEGILRWLITEPQPDTDRYIEDGVRDKLFLRHNVSLDLAATNILRGREQGIPPYNVWREWCGLNKAQSFSANRTGLKDHDNETATLLGQIYRSPNDIDLFTGGVSENHVEDGNVGPTFACIIGRQFRALRDGDRYWYERNDTTVGFTEDQLATIKKINLAKLICQNMKIPIIQRHVFKTPRTSGRFQRNVLCSRMDELDLKAWLDYTPVWPDKPAQIEEPKAKTPKDQTAKKPVGKEAAQKPAEKVAAQTLIEQKAVEKPVGQKAAQTPIEKKAAEKPVGQKVAQTPVEKKAVEKPVGQKVAQTPIEKKAVEKPVEQNVAQTPVERKEVVKPVEKKVARKPVENKAVEKPKPAGQNVAQTPVERKAVEKPVGKKVARKSAGKKPTTKKLAKKLVKTLTAKKRITKKLAKKLVRTLSAKKPTTEKLAKKLVKTITAKKRTAKV